MNKSHLKAKWHELRGKVKEEVGHATGNTKKVILGMVEQVQGTLERNFGDVKDTSKNRMDAVIRNKKNKRRVRQVGLSKS